VGLELFSTILAGGRARGKRHVQTKREAARTIFFQGGERRGRRRYQISVNAKYDRTGGILGLSQKIPIVTNNRLLKADQPPKDVKKTNGVAAPPEENGGRKKRRGLTAAGGTFGRGMDGSIF